MQKAGKLWFLGFLGDIRKIIECNRPQMAHTGILYYNEENYSMFGFRIHGQTV